MRIPEADGDALEKLANEPFDSGGDYYEPGQIETLLVLDIDGTVVVINANLWPGSSAADRARVRRTCSTRSASTPERCPTCRRRALEPGTYYVDEVNGTPTPRIFATLDSGWFDLDAGPGWAHIAKGRHA